MPSAYRIADEPRPSALSHLAVNPFWPLLAFMLAGPWLGWPWFVVNGFAVGSPTRRRELLLVGSGLLGSLLLIVVVLTVLAAFDLRGETPDQLARLTVLLWKLGISYWLFALQSRTFELHVYFGGVARNGILVVVAGMLIGERQVLSHLPDLLRLAFR